MRAYPLSPRLWALLLLLAGACLIHASEPPAADPPHSPGIGLVVTVRDAIGPATSDHLLRALARAAEQKAKLLIFEIDTPGGLDAAMRDMIQGILASSVPVVSYVTPSGARAASAGTYLLYASHVAAMAPATNLGAATPVNMLGQGSGQGEQPEGGTAMERKAVNDAVAYIRGLAELRGRNADWAESAVRTGASLSATDALAQDVVDVIAVDLPDLMRQIDGRTVSLPDGMTVIETDGIVLERIEADWRNRLLATVTNPTFAYLLMLVGVYGLLLEGYNPGALVPGVVGAICLVVALFAFQVLSVNYAGLALMALGLLLIVGEAFVPSFGVLGLGGIIAFTLGSIMLLDNDVPGFAISRSLIGALAVLGGFAALGTATFFVRSRKRPVVTGQEQLLSELAVATSDFAGDGNVRVLGELWTATSRLPVRGGQRLRITGIDGLRLSVEPYDEPPAGPSIPGSTP